MTISFDKEQDRYFSLLDGIKGQKKEKAWTIALC